MFNVESRDVESRFVSALSQYAVALGHYGTLVHLHERRVGGYEEPPAWPEFTGPSPSAVLGSYLDKRLVGGETHLQVREVVRAVHMEFPALVAFDELWRGDHDLVVRDGLSRLGETRWRRITTPEQAAQLVLDEITRVRRLQDEQNIRALQARGLLPCR